MNIKNTQKYKIEKSENGYTVRRIIYAQGFLSKPAEINLPDAKLKKKYKNYSTYCNAINPLIDAELDRIASENFNKGR